MLISTYIFVIKKNIVTFLFGDNTLQWTKRTKKKKLKNIFEDDNISITKSLPNSITSVS